MRRGEETLDVRLTPKAAPVTDVFGEETDRVYRIGIAQAFDRQPVGRLSRQLGERAAVREAAVVGDVVRADLLAEQLGHDERAAIRARHHAVREDQITGRHHGVLARAHEDHGARLRFLAAAQVVPERRDVRPALIVDVHVVALRRGGT